MPAGKTTCNARLRSRDGYCQQKGIAPFERCNSHKASTDVTKIFKNSMSLDQASKLQTLLDDVVSMDNELASAKVMLVSSMEDWGRSREVIESYMDHPPIPPEDMEDEVAVDLYKRALNLHATILEKAIDREAVEYKRSHAMMKLLTEGVAKNKKMKDGSKFTMDVKQIRSIIKAQLEVMAANCAGCPKLKDVVRMLKEKVRDIPLSPEMSKANKKALGMGAYAEEVGMVEELAERAERGEFTDVD